MKNYRFLIFKLFKVIDKHLFKKKLNKRVEFYVYFNKLLNSYSKMNLSLKTS